MVTQVVQFRLDTNIAKKFEKNCDLLNQTKTDTLTLLVENFNKNFREVVNLDETFSVNVNIFPKEPRNEFSLQEVYETLIEISINKQQLKNLLKEELLNTASTTRNPLDLNDLLISVYNDLANLSFTLPEFFNNLGQELYRVDSAYFHRDTGGNGVYSQKVHRNTLSAKMKDYQWQGNIYIYHFDYWDNHAEANSKALKDIKEELKNCVLRAVKKFIGLLIYNIKSS